MSGPGVGELLSLFLCPYQELKMPIYLPDKPDCTKHKSKTNTQAKKKSLSVFSPIVYTQQLCVVCVSVYKN